VTPTAILSITQSRLWFWTAPNRLNGTV